MYFFVYVWIWSMLHMAQFFHFFIEMSNKFKQVIHIEYKIYW